MNVVASEKNPFPPGGITRPGIRPSVTTELTSQGGAIERLEELIRSVIRHGVKKGKDERGRDILKGKPELIMLSGEFGAGKTFALSSVYADCKEGVIKVREKKTERKALILPIYQPLHALISEPEEFLKVLINRLVSEAPTPEIQEVIKKTREDLESALVESDELLRDIYIWRYCVDAAIGHGVDAVVILLDELEESIKDYDEKVSGYAKTFSVLREYVDRQMGPVITILGITPKAIDSMIRDVKEAILRRSIILDLPHLASPGEFFELAQTFDPKIK